MTPVTRFKIFAESAPERVSSTLGKHVFNFNKSLPPPLLQTEYREYRKHVDISPGRIQSRGCRTGLPFH